MITTKSTDDKSTNAAIIDVIHSVEIKLGIVKRYLESQQNRSDDIEYLKGLYEELQALIAKGNLVIGKIYTLMEKLNGSNQE
jgi:hypothetical protein